MFNNGDTTDPEVNAGCGLNATWPSYYGDIIFGPDNCLYDATGKKTSLCFNNKISIIHVFFHTANRY